MSLGPSRGAVWVGIGDKAYVAACRAYTEFKVRNLGEAGMILTDKARVGGLRADFVRVVGKEVGTDEYPAYARAVKTTVLDHVPYDQVLYLDADTLVYDDITAGFKLLDDGFDFVITCSDNQYQDAFWHVEEREMTETGMRDVGYTMLQLQGGVFFAARSPRTEELFKVWHEEWCRYRGLDQAALVRALYKVPVRAWILGKSWNGGSVIGHLFGKFQVP